MNLKFTFRGTSFDVPFGDHGEDRLEILFDMLKELYDVRPESCRIVYQGRKISPYARARDMVLALMPSKGRGGRASSTPTKPKGRGDEVEDDTEGGAKKIPGGPGTSSSPPSLKKPKENNPKENDGAQEEADSHLPLPTSVKIMVVGSTEKDIDFFQSARADPLVKGFDALARDEKARRRRLRKLAKEASGWGGSKMHPEFCFRKIVAEYKYNTPTPFEAEKLLRKLAHDPAIVKIMTDYSAEAQERMAMEGKDGDLLGFNENYGARIVLRLRTDDTKGFRPYYDLVNTLIHELVHNTFGPHDDKFWNLFRKYKKEYDAFHDFYSRGGQTAGGFSAAADRADSSDDEKPQRLGGSEDVLMQEGGNSREARAALAEKRMKMQQVAVGSTLSPAQKPPSLSPRTLPPEQQHDPSLMERCPCGICMNGQKFVPPNREDGCAIASTTPFLEDAEALLDKEEELAKAMEIVDAADDVVEDVQMKDQEGALGTTEQVLKREVEVNQDPTPPAPGPPQAPVPSQQEQQPEAVDDEPEIPPIDEAEWSMLIGHEGAQLLLSLRKSLLDIRAKAKEAHKLALASSSKPSNGTSGGTSTSNTTSAAGKPSTFSSKDLFSVPHRLCKNLIENLGEDKFRSVPLTNAKVKAFIEIGGLPVLEAMGFRKVSPDRLAIAPARFDPGRLIMVRDMLEQFMG
ncbi:unnamed protein product [Amoebophrya sp. A25]|nr:unnamed protein product [Amoebophrya sp. A25]|eukprot:GSA25T00010098001.1